MSLRTRFSKASSPAHLFAAVKANDVAGVRAYLQGGGDINATRLGKKALLLAARKGYAEIALLLLDHDAEVDVTNNAKQTPLMLAAMYGHLAIAEALIKKGARLNLRSKTGNTPIIFAVSNGYGDIAKLMLAHGADPGVANDFGYNAYRIAQEKHPELSPLLLGTAAPVTAATADDLRSLVIEMNRNIYAMRDELAGLKEEIRDLKAGGATTASKSPSILKKLTHG